MGLGEVFTIDGHWCWREGNGEVLSFSPLISPLTRGVGGLQRGPPRVYSCAGEFVVGGAWCPGICDGGSGRQHWGPAPGLRGGKSRKQIPRLASGQGISRGSWRPGVCRRSPGGATGLCVRPEPCKGEGDDTHVIPTLPHPFVQVPSQLPSPSWVVWYQLHQWDGDLGASSTFKPTFNKPRSLDPQTWEYQSSQGLANQ